MSSLTLRRVREEIDDFLQRLLAIDLASYVQPVTIDEGTGRVGWPTRSGVPFLASRGPATWLDYRHWIENGQFSALLRDGALIQVTYDVADGDLRGHRLAYVPCPFQFEPDDLDSMDPVELCDLYGSGPSDQIVLASTIRFDYDPEAAEDGHPATHLSLNTPDCRIACVAPLRIGIFAEIVLGHFYPNYWNKPEMAELPRAHLWDKCIADSDSQRPHLDWPHWT